MLKLIIYGLASFIVGLILSVIVLTSLPFQIWKSFDSSNLKALSVKIPRLYIVQSGSMEPAIKTGSVVVSYPSPNYVQGDVITFAPNGDTKRFITHRIVFKLYPDGPNFSPHYMTAGDANEDFDTWEIKDDYILGKTILTIPYLGYISDYAKKPQGFILLVIVPATIIIYEELKSLISEIRKLLRNVSSKVAIRVKKHRSSYQSPDNLYSLLHLRGESVSTPKRNGLPKIWVLLPFLGAGIVFLGLTSSLFSDIERAVGNALGAGEWLTPSPVPSGAATPTPTQGLTPTPTQTPTSVNPGDVVINELMWMGSTKGASDEWIELRNTTSNTIDISGFQLTKWVTSGTDHEELMFTISSGKSITPDGYFIIAQFPSGDLGSALNVSPDETTTSVVLSNTALQIRVFASNWDTGGILLDSAGNKGSPLAGEHQTSQPKKFYSMERNSSPNDGILSGNWHAAASSIGFDPGEDIENRGTPKSANSPP